MLGYRKFIIRCDGEPALLSTLREAVAHTAGLEAIFRNSPPEDHQANGAAERAVQDVKAHTMVLVADLCTKYLGATLGSLIFTWAPRHAAACISRYRILECGRTVEELRSGRKWRRPTILFGEVAHFTPAGSRPRGVPNTCKGVFVRGSRENGLVLVPDAGRMPEGDPDYQAAHGVPL